MNTSNEYHAIINIFRTLPGTSGRFRPFHMIRGREAEDAWVVKYLSTTTGEAADASPPMMNRRSSTPLTRAPPANIASTQP